ncbi:type II toxin-antitoxin system death-on-curing family toxin (plasmid) [Cereibacter azotoformans]|uniref:Death-on-curing protein n=2 Tax=Cereibacter TaxID=1653176 RepID=A0A2T5JTD1_9RHOB|nr:type II toxin-antitoxin system death-on-curing family toxin [Cereibacter azotoformans]AXQ96065.1 type II toxin-antitoxin system death-on-curing family toxin [Cereibacter sphaeroides]PTR13427.1 death-on-curing protein [Cereibacter azotoformans]UIJ32901.1 type II toxin-antitoxin system death-on-curing family toxin [Cereibacter azotoformans]ULB12149.1 type II toxin-antitoxin system death-on-curing family toxin [Cereibacter azotoformans]
MTAPVWVPLAAIFAIHDRQIARHGGKSGLRDRDLLASGSARPVDLWSCGTPTLEELAASCAFGITKAHAFIDGNKRTAFVTAVTFLRLNGVAFRPDAAEGVRMMEGLAADAVSEAELAKWLQAGSRPILIGAAR